MKTAHLEARMIGTVILDGYVTWYDGPRQSYIPIGDTIMAAKKKSAKKGAAKKGAAKKVAAKKGVSKKAPAKKPSAKRTLGKASPTYRKRPEIIGSQSTDTASAPVAGQAPMTLNAPIMPVVVDERPKPAA